MRPLSSLVPILGSLSLTVIFGVGSAFAALPVPSPSPAASKSKIDLTPFAKRKRVRPAPATPAVGPLEKNPFVTFKKRKEPEPFGSPIPKGQRITRKARGPLPVIGESAAQLPLHSFEIRSAGKSGHELAFQSRDGKFRWDSTKPFAIQVFTSWGLSSKPALVLDTDAPAAFKLAPFSLPVEFKVTQGNLATQPVRVVASYTVCGVDAVKSPCRKVTTSRTYTAAELHLTGKSVGR